MNKHTKEVIERLEAQYGTDYVCYLHHENALQLLIATMLSAQCTDARVNIVTKDLFRKYDTLEKFANANLEELEQDIKPTGFYHNKAKNIIACAKRLVYEFGGEVPSSLEDLTSLAGVGRKTANVIRGNIYHEPSIVVDTHVKRISKKLGFTENQKIILCVGELLANKNQQMIIKCMPQILEKIPEARLLIAGNGSKRDELEALIGSLNLQEKVVMLGYATNIEEYHQISDILVSCSIREGLPVNVIESMMIGNPVVLTDNRGHRELIDEGRCGYLVKINDIDHTSENIKNILLSKDKYKTFSKNTKLFSHVYSSGVVKKEIGNLYELLIR